MIAWSSAFLYFRNLLRRESPQAQFFTGGIDGFFCGFKEQAALAVFQSAQRSDSLNQLFLRSQQVRAV